MDDTWMMVETKLRVPPWLAIATIVKGHHMSTTYLCCLGPSALPARDDHHFPKTPKPLR